MRTIRGTALVVASRFGSKLLVLLVVILSQRYMSPDRYGQLNTLIIDAALVSFFLDVGFRPLFTREVAKDTSRLTPYLNKILTLKLILSLPVLALLALVVAVIQPSLTYLIVPTFCLLVATSLANQLRAVFYAMGELRYEGIAVIAESVVLLAAALLIVAFRLPFYFFLWAYTAQWSFTAIFAAVIAVRRFGHRFAIDFDAPTIRTLARESVPFGVAVFLSTAYFKIDVPMMTVLTSFVAVGVYSAAYKYLEALVAVPQTLMDPVFPTLARLAQEPERLAQAATRTYKMLAAVGVPLTVAMFVYADGIVHYLAGDQYAGAASVLRVLAVAVAFLFANNTFIYTLNAMGHQGDSTRLAAMSLVLNVGLNLVLIPYFNPHGYLGAAWATVLTEIGLFAGGWWMLRRQLYSLPLLSSLRGILPSGLLCAVAMGGVVLWLGQGIPVYVLAGVAGALAYGGALLGTHAFTDSELALIREAARSRSGR